MFELVLVVKVEVALVVVAVVVVFVVRHNDNIEPFSKKIKSLYSS